MAKVYDAAEGKRTVPLNLSLNSLTTPLVAKHTSESDCWVILYGDVYDVSGFIHSHPGGAKIILKLSGQDATEGY